MKEKSKGHFTRSPLARRVDALRAAVGLFAAWQLESRDLLLSKLFPSTSSVGWTLLLSFIFVYCLFETSISHHQNYASPRTMRARSCCPLLWEQART